MDLKEIKAVIDLMTKNGLAEFELERQEFKIRIKKGEIAEIRGNLAQSGPSQAQLAVPAAAPLALPETSAAPAVPTNVKPILSPMVGTFYGSPSPDSPAYISVGQQVTEETVVCIIEAMKVMNEIKAEVRGTVTEVLAENGKPVDFNKPLFTVKV